MALENYFAAEAILVERIKSRVPELKAILTPSDLAGMVESSQPSPCVHVIYSGDRVSSDAVGNGAVSKVYQRWLFVVGVRHNKAQLQNTTELRLLAGPLIIKVLKSVQGFQPVPEIRPMHRSGGGPVPGYSPAFGYFPFMFEGLIVL